MQLNNELGKRWVGRLNETAAVPVVPPACAQNWPVAHALLHPRCLLPYGTEQAGGRPLPPLTPFKLNFKLHLMSVGDDHTCKHHIVEIQVLEGGLGPAITLLWI